MKKINLLFLIGIILISITAQSCISESKNSTAKEEQELTEKKQAHFLENQPPVTIDWSLERDQINRRTARWNDENKVSYIYLISDMGTVIGYFPIKGKVSSVNSQITNPQQIVVSSYHNTAGRSKHVLDSPAEDGSYGTNGDGIFFFLTDGTYMEWSGKYLLCDNSVRLSQEPLMVYDMTKKKKKN